MTIGGILLIFAVTCGIASFYFLWLAYMDLVSIEDQMKLAEMKATFASMEAALTRIKNNIDSEK